MSLAHMDAHSTSTIDQPGFIVGSSTSSRRMSLCPWKRSAFSVYSSIESWFQVAPRSGSRAPRTGAQDDGGDDDQAAKYELLGNAQPKDDQTVVYRSEQKRPYHCTDHASLATCKGRPTN